MHWTEKMFMLTFWNRLEGPIKFKVALELGSARRNRQQGHEASINRRNISEYLTCDCSPFVLNTGYFLSGKQPNVATANFECLVDLKQDRPS
jgi:hypothetical protein